MKSYRYKVVDVFTTEALEGNALAVFPDASDLEATTMQKIAREFNLAETAFVLPATREDCAATLRIFTPAKEMVFAGHPTVASAFVLLEEGIVPKNSSAFVVEEKIGPVPIRLDSGARPMIWLRTPPILEGRCYDSALCAAALGLAPRDLLPLEPQLLNAGNPTVIVAAQDKAAVDRASLDLAGLRALKGGETEPFCVFLFTPTPEGAYSRMFAPEYGVAVISDGLWRRQFGADPHVLGRRILADEDGYTIVGVMPPDFRHPGQGLTADVELWTAAGFKANPFPIPPPRAYRYLPGALGRLKAGLTVQLAQQRLDAFVAELSRSYPTEYPVASRWSVRLESIEESWTCSVRPMLVVLLAAVGFVLLIVAVNLARLLVARSSARTREIAIRQALGASRPRLVRQLLTESILLSLAGGSPSARKNRFRGFLGNLSISVFGAEHDSGVSEARLDVKREILTN